MIFNILSHAKAKYTYNLKCSRYMSTMISEARKKLNKIGSGKILLDLDNNTNIATVTLDNPEKKNALSGTMMIQLEEILCELENWKSGKVVILQANGDNFCSGGDLSMAEALCNPYDGFLMSSFMHSLISRFCHLPMVTVSVVHGRAIGGGAELTTITDYRLFTPAGEVSFVQGHLGVTTGWGGGTRLAKIIGPRLALKVLCTSQKIGPSYAKTIGFCDGLIESTENRLTEAVNWISPWTKHDADVIRAYKNVIMGSQDRVLEESLLNERIEFRTVWGSPSHQEALKKNIKHR